MDDSSDLSDTDNSLEQQLSTIGAFSSLRMPRFGWSLPVSMELSSLSRTEQVTNLIEDLRSGFSLQSALDRFQTLRTLLASQVDRAIDNGVDTSDEEDAVPHVITAAAEPKEVPRLDQVIIPQDKEPRRRKRRHTLKGSHLIKLTDDQKNDETLLRERILQIRQLDASDETKNMLVQQLMMGAHYDKVKFVDDQGEEVFQISTKEHQSSSELNAEPKHQKPVVVTEEDRRPMYHDVDEETLGCPHYQRACKMECPRCQKWSGCPKCHDEEVTDHKFQREATRHVMCMNCFNVQVPTEFCDSCDLQFSHYFCDVCKLYDDDDAKDIYHCDDCGICRLGLGLGQDFFHCKGCNACLSVELQDDHKCIERATQSDCPICGEYMFTSTKPVVFMSCGHAIHQGCFDEHSKHSYKCPTCQKTVLNMEAQFRVLDTEISSQPLPDPYCNWTCVVICNDCNGKSQCPYHVLGLKCDNCKSYNTVQVKLLKPEETDDDLSDLSTATNMLRHRAPGRNLRNLPISSHLLGTNFAIERTLSEDESTKEDRVLTIPQQLLSNFDSYLNNMQESEDESDEDGDFLRVSKAIKESKRQLDMLGDSAMDDDMGPVPQSSRGSTIANAVKDFLNRGTDRVNGASKEQQ